MVTYNFVSWDGESRLNNKLARNYVEGACLSSDEKPDDVANGSKLIEMDTGKIYIFDLANETWREL